MRTIRVRVVESARDGVLFKWTDYENAPRQLTYEGRRTRNLIDKARTELEERLNRPGAARRWADFEERFLSSFLRGMTPKGQGKPKTMVRRFREQLASFGDENMECSAINEETVLSVKERMEDEGLKPMTIRTNMGALWSVLNWGADNHLLPRLHRPREFARGDRKGKSKAKGRAFVLEEVERMVSAVKENPVVRPDLTPALQRVRKIEESAELAIRAIHVCRLTGMRSDDMHGFRWDPCPGFH
ncbi:MAG: hypothetical protein AAFU85_25180 [Planctomycetota bacterium]